MHLMSLAPFFQTLVKTFEVCDLPVRASKFVARKNWVITGAVSFSCCYVVHKYVVVLLLQLKNLCLNYIVVFLRMTCKFVSSTTTLWSVFTCLRHTLTTSAALLSTPHSLTSSLAVVSTKQNYTTAWLTFSSQEF